MSGNGLGFQNAAYAVSDRPAMSSSGGDRGDVEFAHDPASSGIFGSSDKKHTDIKAMLDSNDELKKLEAMKRIVGMVAKGRDASELFPAVVKNVASKNIELKKLVYVYLTRYAEEQQDLALLSISTFQRSMKDPNQLIRASALRVLSSVRVPVIVPIMMLAIKDGVSDMSPYVRKAAAHAIPKLYSVDPDQKEELVQLLEKLLGDKTTLVAGSAIQAFEEVCPERIDLIHKNYRKLCNLLVDVEEWGQVVIINMLTRYVRSQFVDPNQEGSATSNEDDPKKEFFSDDEASDEEGKGKKEPPKKVFMMDPDHRLLLRSAKPLLSSRNTAVVLAVVQLYYHCAPRSEVGLVAKALTRLLRSHREVQYIVLSCIVSMSLERKGLFEPHIKSFFIRANDPIHIKLLKLEILTNIAAETSVSVILREFQTYVMSSDKEFAAATIHAIGRIASNIADITDACLGGLVHLLSNRDETVVGESIVVIKKLLQMRPTAHKDIIVHLAKLAEKVTVPNARASILWLLGEYSDRVPKIAPDVLRKMAKTFVSEHDIVKLQVLNLAAKLCLTNPKQTQLLCQYVFALAKYDLSYDIRDRARFLKALVLPVAASSADGNAPASIGALAKMAKKIFLADKPAPVLDSKFHGREPYQLGSLSHVINQPAHGYHALPDWPAVAPDPSVRNVEIPVPFSLTATGGQDKKKRNKGSASADTSAKKKASDQFYSDEEEEESEEASDDGDDDDDDDEEEEEDGEEEESEDDSSETDEDDSSSEGADSNDGSEEEESKEKSKAKRQKETNGNRASAARGDAAAHSSENDDETSSGEESSDDSSSEEEKAKPKALKSGSQQRAAPPKAQPAKKDSDLLLDFLDFGPSSGSSLVQPTVGQTASGMLVPSLTSDFNKLKMDSSQSTSLVSLPVYVPTQTYELLNRMTSNGLSASYKFPRSMSTFSPKMVTVELTFQNLSDSPISNIRVGLKRLQPGMSMQDFVAVPVLAAKGSCSVSAGIDFNDTLQPAAFDIVAQDRQYGVSIRAPVGELVQPTTMTEGEFKAKQAKLGGMNENTANCELRFGDEGVAYAVCSRVCKSANILQVPCSSSGTYLFAGRTASAGADVLVKVVANVASETSGSSARVTVNCEKMVIGSMLLKDVSHALTGESK